MDCHSLFWRKGKISFSDLWSNCFNIYLASRFSLGWDIKRATLSVHKYRLTTAPTLSAMPLIANKNRVSLRMEPCGTPFLCSCWHDRTSLTRILNILPSRKIFMNKGNWPLKPHSWSWWRMSYVHALSYSCPKNWLLCAYTRR